MPIKDNDEAVRRFGIEHAISVCRHLLDSGIVNGLHLYTLNREYATIQILKAVGLWHEDPVKSLPWRRTANPARCKEDVRPIFWSMRPQSYVDRTSDWDEFPNGRWGNSSAATFGESNHYLFYLNSREPSETRLAMWGKSLNSEEDVWDVMARFVSGQPNSDGIKVSFVYNHSWVILFFVFQNLISIVFLSLVIFLCKKF